MLFVMRTPEIKHVPVRYGMPPQNPHNIASGTLGRLTPLIARKSRYNRVRKPYKDVPVPGLCKAREKVPKLVELVGVFLA